MTAALRRRLATVEEATLRRQAQQLAALHGVDVNELLVEARRFATEVARLRASGLSEQEATRALIARKAGELGMPLAEFEAGFERARQRAVVR